MQNRAIGTELLDFARNNGPAVSLLAGITAVLIACTLISVIGMRPPGEAEMLKKIKLEDSYLCEKFGLQAETRRFWDCMLDLSDLRKRHMEMVAAYDFP
jgi:hypothetical protein